MENLHKVSATTSPTLLLSATFSLSLSFPLPPFPFSVLCQKARDRTISVSGSTAREGVFIQTFRKEVVKPKDSGEEEVL